MSDPRETVDTAQRVKAERRTLRGLRIWRLERLEREGTATDEERLELQQLREDETWDQERVRSEAAAIREAWGITEPGVQRGAKDVAIPMAPVGEA